MAQIPQIIAQNPVWSFAIAGLVSINLITLAAFGLDKYLARKKASRISEFKLLLLIAVGGGVGAIAGQRLYRHKTRKQPFKRQMWTIIAIQTAIILIGFFAYLLRIDV